MCSGFKSEYLGSFEVISRPEQLWGMIPGTKLDLLTKKYLRQDILRQSTQTKAWGKHSSPRNCLDKKVGILIHAKYDRCVIA